MRTGREEDGSRPGPSTWSTTGLIIFDCDGVLVDSEVISNRILAEHLTAAGLPTTLPEARSLYQGLLMPHVVTRAEERLGRALPDGWLDGYQRERIEAFRRELRSVEGAAELLECLRETGIDFCVASQGSLEKTRLSLELTGLDHLVPAEAVFSAHQVERGKPSPELFLYAAASFATDPAHCLVVEDSPTGVAAAVAAAMPVAGYAADSDEEALREAGAEILLSLAELPALLGLPGPAPRPGNGRPAPG